MFDKTNNHHLAELEEAFDQPNLEDEADEREYQEYKQARKLKKQQKRERKEQEAKEKKERKATKVRASKDKPKEPNRMLGGKHQNRSGSGHTIGDVEGARQEEEGREDVDLLRLPATRGPDTAGRYRGHRVIRLFLRRKPSRGGQVHHEYLEPEQIQEEREEQGDPRIEQRLLLGTAPGVVVKGGYWRRVWSKLRPLNKS
ncbi:MAG: hypothetical protein J3Q66DRAFT_367885 [Benniella sp.]|nr:MAG: hypothetical protein J3Q66DRAFT_367885 [Benniella sp.]